MMENNSTIERRYINVPISKIEVRMDEDSETKYIEGIAALFNQKTQIGSKRWGFMESIAPGAFDDVLEDDVRCLFNHNPNQILGRTKSKTLEIWVDAKGLHFRCKVPNRSYAADLLDAINSGDVDGCSFAFQVKERTYKQAESDDKMDERTIIEFSKLFDVSPVTFPAYEGTSIDQRSLDDYKEWKDSLEGSRNQKRNNALATVRAKYKFNINNLK